MDTTEEDPQKKEAKVKELGERLASMREEAVSVSVPESTSAAG